MIEYKAGTIQLYQQRTFEDWHSPFPREFSRQAMGCFNGSCPVDEHGWTNGATERDPYSGLTPERFEQGAKLLILSDFCDRKHISYMTLDSIQSPSAGMQLRFREHSRDCDFFIPRIANGVGHAYRIQLDSIRYLAVVPSEAPSFGKDGGLACFTKELCRIGGLEENEVEEGLQQLADTLPKQERLLLKPWQIQARNLWRNFQSRDTMALRQDVRWLTSFTGGYHPFAIFLTVATHHGKLGEVLRYIEGVDLSKIPEALSPALHYCTGTLSGHHAQFREEAPRWWAEWKQAFSLLL